MANFGRAHDAMRTLLWRYRAAVLAAPAVAALVLGLRATGLLQAWEWAAYDQYMRLRPAEPRDERIAIVGIDEQMVDRVGNPIFPDAVYADLLETLAAQNPRAIGFDVYRDVPVEPGHDRLKAAFENIPNLLGITKVSGDNSWEKVAPPPALAEAGRATSNDFIRDADDRVRRALLFVDAFQRETRNASGQLAGVQLCTEGDSTCEIQTYSSLGLYLAYLYLKPEGIEPEVESQVIRWGDAKFHRFQPNDGGYVRANPGGWQILLNYRGGRETFETVSAADLLDGKLPDDWATDRVVLIGATGESFKDFFLSPYSTELIGTSAPMAGVEIHANLTSEIVATVLDGRPPIRTWPEWAEWVWVFAWSTAGALSAQLLQRPGARARVVAATSTVGVTGALGLLLGSAYGLFVQGWWVPVVPPALALVGSAVAIVAFVAQSAGRIRETFGRYLTSEVVANLLEHPEGLKMGGERRQITILTSDLRGFTSISERLPPEEVIQILNLYLGRMADTIVSYQGTIDEFMGDGILVLFGAPTARPDDAQRAVACAIAMQLEMAAVNAEMQARGFPALEMGIGINTGEVVVGNIGSQTRTKYGVVGRQVNLTYRIESYTVGGQILATESVLAAGDRQAIAIVGTQQVQPKGVSEPMTIYEIGGIGEPYNLDLPRDREDLLPLVPWVLVRYQGIDGKHVNRTTHTARMVTLSDRGAELQLMAPADAPRPKTLTNIRLRLVPAAGAIAPHVEEPSPTATGADGNDLSEREIYAKVMRHTETGFYVCFTAKAPQAETLLADLYQQAQQGATGGTQATAAMAATASATPESAAPSSADPPKTAPPVAAIEGGASVDYGASGAGASGSAPSEAGVSGAGLTGSKAETSST